MLDEIGNLSRCDPRPWVVLLPESSWSEPASMAARSQSQRVALGYTALATGPRAVAVRAQTDSTASRPVGYRDGLWDVEAGVLGADGANPARVV